MPTKEIPLDVKFWQKVHKTDSCWLWTAGKFGNGYGIIRHRFKSLLAHRVSWELHNGAIPVGLVACHTCDTPLCVNPAHLFLGTRSDNMRDCKNKGRARNGIQRGERNGNHKLTTEQVAEIRELRKTHGLSYPQLGRRFGVVHSTIKCIILGETRNSG